MQAPSDDELAGQEGPQAQHENNQGQDKSIETRSISSAEESFKTSPITADDEMPDPSKVSGADNFTQRCHAYLSKLDISMELAGPDLYSQCMSLLGLDQTATVDKDTAIIVNLKVGYPRQLCFFFSLSISFSIHKHILLFYWSFSYVFSAVYVVGWWKGSFKKF